MQDILSEPVYSLVVDIVDSTKRLMEFTKPEADSFNIALSKVLQPLIVMADLPDSVVKFTGDGWIVSVSAPTWEKVIRLVALAIFLKVKFNPDIEKLTSMKFVRRWDLRFGLAHELDIRVKFNERDDFVGDSIRRAKRISGLCYPNEILIDSAIRSTIFRDFETSAVDIEKRKGELGVSKLETDIDMVYSVEKPKRGEFINPDIKVVLFDLLGIEKEEELLINHLKSRAENQALSSTELASIDLASINLSTLVGKTTDSKIIDKKLEGVGYQRPLLFWNRKINLYRDYTSARSVLDDMRLANVQPDVVTFTTLMNKADNYADAKSVLDEMRSADIQPNVATYYALFSKDIGDFKIENVHEDYLAEENRSSPVLEPLIESLFSEKRFRDAYYLILNYPHLSAARKIVRENFRLSISMYDCFKMKDFYESNIDYAFGIAYFDIGRRDKAIKHLKRALMLATTKQRIKHIQGLLEQSGE